MDLKSLIGTQKNFVFIGEAGSGKSEIALNFAAELHALGEKPVHFFDMDMTKPLFRSRDVEESLTATGIHVHYQEQFYDAPTVVGGVRLLLKDQEIFTVLDVGGDYIGARSIGGFQQELNREDTAIYYVLNAFRPWSYDIEHIDETMGKILGVSHIKMEKLHMVNNSNNGPQTTAEEFLEGTKQLEKAIAPYASILFSCVHDELYSQVARELSMPLLPIKLYLTYPWQPVSMPIKK
ncbi:MAG: hypothetical protein H6Q73_2210 [Firmicutes bacterium]|nr:hypothetical protein [Bacillota bacterium]